MLSTYEETIEFLYSNLAVYQHIGPKAYKKDLSNTLTLCEYLDNPHQKFYSVHVAGTNGKGSSSHMLAAILQASGYKTGLYTSPHLKDFRERIKINGIEIEKDFVVDFVNRMLETIARVEPSFFELTVAMAFQYFAEKKIDIAIIEVGLGGRLDSTNVINPLTSLITNIGYDHMDILGNTLTEIAREKAGIIKKRKPAVISERQIEIENVFKHKAEAEEAPLIFASDEIEIVPQDYNSLKVKERNQPEYIISPELKGHYQNRNIKGVIETARQLEKMGYKISTDSIVEGINKTISFTGLKGRWQKLQDRPLVIADTAHNAEGIFEVVKQIKKTPYKALKWVFGMVKDKSPDKILSILPKNAFYYFCQAKIARAMDATDLQKSALEKGLSGTVVTDVKEALQKAISDSEPDDLIMIGGSTFVVGETDL